MIRSAKVDLTVLGGMQVAENGDLANWMIPGKVVKGMGGAMDLVAGVKRCIALFDHTNKRGESKFLKACTLPLTGQNCIDMVITDLGVFARDDKQSDFRVKELANGVTANEVRAKTQARIIFE
jgi:3-oxoacid CoA-transferase B subunit